MQEHMQHLRPQGYGLPCTTQGNALGIQLAIVEGVDYDPVPTAESERVLRRPWMCQREGTGLAQRTLAQRQSPGNVLCGGGGYSARTAGAKSLLPCLSTLLSRVSAVAMLVASNLITATGESYA